MNKPPNSSHYKIYLIDEPYQSAATVILDYEDELSDGFLYHCSSEMSDEDRDRYGGDPVLATVARMAKEIVMMAKGTT
ncbi:MAG: hypothetical protein GY938_16555 [Ketobacter sp.]|nr:hypothetical protein [Ketobacter sp.]